MTAPGGRLISLAAGVSPELHAEPASFVAAAADAGWSAAGIWFDCDSWTAETTATIKRRLEATGVTPLDMEVVRMGTDRDHGEALVEAAAELGVSNILTISSFEDPGATTQRFAELCELAAPAGVHVCLEYMIFTHVRSLAEAIDIVDRAAQPNGGVLIDLLHVARAGTKFEEIAAADPRRFPYVQWCDGPAEPRGWSTRDLIGDALDDRSMPGRGRLHAAEFERLFDEAVPFSLEVRSKALRDAFPDHRDRAAHVLARTRAALGY